VTGPRNGPPKEVGPQDTTPRGTDINITDTLDSADNSIVGQWQRRHRASRRLPVLASGRADPWRYPPATDGYAAAARHLLEQGFTPAPNWEALRAMWKRGDDRIVAELVAARWGIVA